MTNLPIQQSEFFSLSTLDQWFAFVQKNTDGLLDQYLDEAIYDSSASSLEVFLGSGLLFFQLLLGIPHISYNPVLGDLLGNFHFVKHRSVQNVSRFEVLPVDLQVIFGIRTEMNVRFAYSYQRKYF